MLNLADIDARLQRIERLLSQLVGVDSPAPLDAVTMERIMSSGDPVAALRERNRQIRQKRRAGKGKQG